MTIARYSSTGSNDFASIAETEHRANSELATGQALCGKSIGFAYLKERCYQRNRLTHPDKSVESLDVITKLEKTDILLVDSLITLNYFGNVAFRKSVRDFQAQSLNVSSSQETPSGGELLELAYNQLVPKCGRFICCYRNSEDKSVWAIANKFQIKYEIAKTMGLEKNFG